MPRQGRIHLAGGIYHVIQRGIERRDIFIDDPERQEFIRRLSENLKTSGHKCYGWVLMPNHFHLIIRTGAGPLSDLMRKLLTGYALYFNKKYKRHGYLYQNRYKSILCQEEEYLLELIRYVHLNPIRAGLVKGISELSRYPWSGHSVVMGKRQAKWQSSGEILKRFGKKKSEAVQKYEAFLAEAEDIPGRKELTGSGLIKSARGWMEAVDLKRSDEKWSADERILGDEDFVDAVLKQAEEELLERERLKKAGWGMERLVKEVCRLMQVDEKDIQRKSKRSAIAQARSLIAYFGNKELGITGVELAKHFGITKSSISSAITRGSKLAAEKRKKYRII